MDSFFGTLAPSYKKPKKMMMTEICAKLHMGPEPQNYTLESLEDRILCKTFMENICTSSMEELRIRRDFANARWSAILFQRMGHMTEEQIAEFNQRWLAWRSCVVAINARICDLENRW